MNEVIRGKKRSGQPKKFSCSYSFWRNKIDRRRAMGSRTRRRRMQQAGDDNADLGAAKSPAVCNFLLHFKRFCCDEERR